MAKLEISPPSVAARPKLELSEETIEEMGLPNDEEVLDDHSRKTGDFMVYGFYMRLAGRWTFAMYLVLCAGFVFGLTFPCKLFCLIGVLMELD